MKRLGIAPDGGMSGDTLDAIKALGIGDVLMVAMELQDKQRKGKTFTWRYFALVTKTFKHGRFVEALVLDEKEREPRQLAFFREDTTIQLLDESEWPDGVHAFRTKAILDGRVGIDLY